MASYSLNSRPEKEAKYVFKKKRQTKCWPKKMFLSPSNFPIFMWISNGSGKDDKKLRSFKTFHANRLFAKQEQENNNLEYLMLISMVSSSCLFIFVPVDCGGRNAKPMQIREVVHHHDHDLITLQVAHYSLFLLVWVKCIRFNFKV